MSGEREGEGVREGEKERERERERELVQWVETRILWREGVGRRNIL